MTYLTGIILVIVLYFLFRKRQSQDSSRKVSLAPASEKPDFQPIALVIDTETTGLIKDNSIRVSKKAISEDPDNFPRIVQLCYLLIDREGYYDGDMLYIKQDKPIPKAAQKVHKISDEKCSKEGVDLSKALEDLANASQKVDHIIGHNIMFDYKVLQAEYLKAGIAFPFRTHNRVDTMKLMAKHLDKRASYKISLQNSAEELFGGSRGWSETKAQFTSHDAQSDAFITTMIFNTLAPEL